MSKKAEPPIPFDEALKRVWAAPHKPKTAAKKAKSKKKVP